jgi:transcription initiation factor TFIID subunit 6
MFKDTIKVIAETVGIPKTKDDIAIALATDVEYRLREIAQEAMKFMRHSRRDVLTTEDVNNALKLRNIERLYGYTFRDPLRFVRANGHKDLFFLEEKELDFKEILSVPLPKCPREVSFQLHWLAIDGVQPAIPQNPAVILPSENQSNLKRKLSAMETGETKSLTPAVPNQQPQNTTIPGVTIKATVKHTLSRELQLYYEKVTSAVMSMGTIKQRDDEPEARETTKKTIYSGFSKFKRRSWFTSVSPLFYKICFTGNIEKFI